MTSNIFVLDTSVIVNDPQCLESFESSILVLPINVLTELDKIKTWSGETGRNARIFIRKLEELSDGIDVRQGIPLHDTNSTIFVDTTENGGGLGDDDYVDNQIIQSAISFQKKYQDKKVTVVSRDINLRLRARSYGISASNYEESKTLTSEFYSGYRTVVNSYFGNRIIEQHHLECSEHESLRSIYPQECIHFMNETGRGMALGRRINGCIKLIEDNRPWNLKTRNIEQAFAVDLLLDPSVPLVSLAGIAGTGKTLVTVACGLESVISRKTYNKMVIYRPVQPVGTDIGYLPGDMADKLDPWMAAIKDSFEFLSSKSRKKKSGMPNRDSWKDSFAQFGDMIHMDALTYIRGRSISNAFIIIDECQNISKEEIKTILTRAGEGSKIVITGDIEQIDNNKLDAENNGLSYVLDKFRDSELAGHVTFTKGERSPLATLAATIL